MPKVDWSSFVDRHRGAHLIVASVPIEESQDIGTRDLKILHIQMSGLLTRLAPSGDYAVAIVRSTGSPEIHAGFQRQSDADRLAGVVKAEPMDRSPGWASERRFVLDAPTSAALAASMATEGELDER